MKKTLFFCVLMVTSCHLQCVNECKLEARRKELAVLQVLSYEQLVEVEKLRPQSAGKSARLLNIVQLFKVQKSK